jgi:DUF971 family protein
MSNDIRFSRQASTPTEIRNQGKTRLRITWTDGHVSVFEAPFLRGSCPCASCVDEITGERRFGPQNATADVQISGLQLVGNYAVQIDWSDGHSTGIYSFDYLRWLCTCDSCTA